MLSTTLRFRLVVPALWTKGDRRDEWLQELFVEEFDPGCIVPDDPGEVVRHARPADERDRGHIREQQIARMQADAAAVRARELRLRTAPASATTLRWNDDAAGC